MIIALWRFMRAAARITLEIEILPTLRAMVEREHVKESTMGSYAAVRQIATCYHDWKPRPGVLFGYMHVDARCTECKTWWRSQ